jgi:antirestriction protein ArdC
VRKGEKSTISIYYKSYRTEIADEATGDPRDETRRVLRAYAVFNAQQIDGLPGHFQASAWEDRPPQPESEKRAAIDAFFASLPGDVPHGGGQAYYAPSSDHIQIPEPQAFISYEHYGATLGPEYAHWSGAEKRLARNLGKKFGDHAYAVEELTAELTSAILGSELELPVSHLDNHASYIASWIRVLKTDSRAILTIASKAEEAASYLLALAGRGLRPEPVEKGACDAAPAPPARR